MFQIYAGLKTIAVEDRKWPDRLAWRGRTGLARYRRTSIELVTEGLLDDGGQSTTRAGGQLLGLSEKVLIHADRGTGHMPKHTTVDIGALEELGGNRKVASDAAWA